MCGEVTRAQVSSLLLIYFLIFIRAETQCDSTMIADCTQAAVSGRLGELRAGGECRAKTYAYFTHSCLVSHYHMHPTDHCCCVVDTAVLCCRYHQTFDHFRCSLPEDTIYTIKKTFLTYGVIIAVTIVTSGVAITIIALISRFCATRLQRKEAECRRHRDTSHPCYHDRVKAKLEPSAPPLEAELDMMSSHSSHWLLTTSDSLHQQLLAENSDEHSLTMPQVVSQFSTTDTIVSHLSGTDTALTIDSELSSTNNHTADTIVYQTRATDTALTSASQSADIPQTTRNNTVLPSSNSFS